MNSPILLDILIAAILLLFTILGTKKGFVLTLCGLVAVLVAFVGANFVSNAAAPMVADAIQPRVEQAIQESIEDTFSSVNFTDSYEVASQTLTALREKGGVYEWAANALDGPLEEFLLSAVQNPDGCVVDLSVPIARAASTAATTIAAQLAKGIIFIVAFILILILWFFISHALDLVTKLPGLNALNGTLGGALGLIKGLIIAYLAVWILSDLLGYVSPAVAQETHLFRFLLEHGPLTLLSNT